MLPFQSYARLVYVREMHAHVHKWRLLQQSSTRSHLSHSRLYDVMDIEYLYEMIDIIGGAGQCLTLINLWHRNYFWHQLCYTSLNNMHKLLAVCAVTVFLATVSKYIFPFHSFQNGNLEKINFLVVWPYGHTFTDSLKSFEDMIHYRSFEHNLSGCDTKACRKRMRDSNPWPLWTSVIPSSAIPTELPVPKKKNSPQNNLTFH